jgi:hypothetical protein
MAQTVIIRLTDDIDGGEADETVTFALNGQKYEIDLSNVNATKLREAFAPFIEKARVVDGAGGRSGKRRSPSRPESGAKTLFSGLEPGEKERFRDWAKMPTARRIGNAKVQEWIDSGRP